MFDRTDFFRRLAGAFAALPPGREMGLVLEMVSTFLDADRVWTVEFSEDYQLWWVAQEWCAKGVDACLPDLPAVPIGVIAPAMVAFFQGKSVIYEDIEKLPASSRELKEEMRRQGNRATAAVPIFEGDCLRLLIGVDDVRQKHRWTLEEMHALEEVGQLLLIAERARLLPMESVPTSFTANTPAPRTKEETFPLPEGCYLRIGQTHLKVHWSEMVALEAEGDYSLVRLTDVRTHLERRTLSQWEVILPKKDFLRVHRSWIVNWSHVQRLDRKGGGRWSLQLRHMGNPVPVGRAFQSTVSARIARSVLNDSSAQP